METFPVSKHGRAIGRIAAAWFVVAPHLATAAGPPARRESGLVTLGFTPDVMPVGDVDFLR